MFSCCIRPPPDTASKYSAHGPEAATNTTHHIVAAGSAGQQLAPAPQALHTLHNPRHPQLKQEVPPQYAARPSASPAAFVPSKPVYSTAHPPPQPIPSEQPSPVDSARLDQPWSELAAAATSAQGVLQPVHATPPRDSQAAKGQQLSGHSGDRYRAWDPNTPRTPAPRTADSSPITPRSASVSDLSEPDVYQKYGSSADSDDEGQEAADLDPSTDLDAFRQRQATAGDESQQQLLEQHSSYVSAVSHPSALASPSAPQSPAAASHAAQLPPSFHRSTSPTHHQHSPFQHGGRQQQGGPGGAVSPWAAPSGLHAAEWHTNDSSHAPATVHSSKAAGLVGGSAWHAVLHQNPHLGLGGEQASPCNPVYSSPGHPQQSLGSSPDSSPDKAAGKSIPTFRPQGPSLPMTSSVGMRTISTAVQQLQQQRAGLHPHPPAPHPTQAPCSGVLPPATPAPPSQPHPSSLLSSSSSAQLPPALTPPLSQACFNAASISSPAAPSVLPTHTPFVLPTHTPTPLTPPDKSSGLVTPAAASHTPFSTKPSQAADQQQLDGMAAAAVAAANPANCHSQPMGGDLQPRRVSQGTALEGPLTTTTTTTSPSDTTPVSQAGRQGVPPTTSPPRSSENSPPGPPLPRYQQPTAASAARSALSPALSCSSSSSLPASSRRASQAGEAEGGEGAAAASHLTPRNSLTRRTSQPGAAPQAPGLASLPPAAAAAHPPLTLPGHPRPGASGSSSRPGSLRSSRSGGEQQQQGEPGAPNKQAAAPPPGSVVAGAVEQGASSSTGSSTGPRGSQLPSAGAAGRGAPGVMDARGKEGKAGGEGLGSSSPGARANSAPLTRASGRPHPPGTPPGPSSKAGGASPVARSPELSSNKVQRKVGELGNGQAPASPPPAAPGGKAGASRAAHAPNAKTSATHTAHSPVAKTSATHAAHAPPAKTGNPASGTTQGNHVGPGDKAAASTSAHGTTAHSTQPHAQPSKGGSSASSSSKGSDARPGAAAGPDAAAGAGGPGAESRPAAAPPPAPSATPPGSLPYGQWRLVRVQEVGGRRCAACDGTVAQETNDGEQEIFECDQVLAPGTLAAAIQHERYEEDSEGSQPHLWLFCVDPLCLDSKPYRSRLPAWPKKMMLDTGVKITRSEFANIKDMGMDVAAPAAPKP